MKKIAVWVILIMTALSSSAQQSSIYSQYMFNGLAINPAYAGYDGMLSLTALGRIQSLGLEGSPNTQTFSAHTPIYNNRVGIGLQFFHEQVGVTDQTGVYGSYSYKIGFEKLSISFGLQAGVNFYKTNYTSLATKDPGDPVFNTDTKTVTPNIGSGVILSNKKLFVGLSVPQMLAVGDENKVVVQEKPIILFGGYIIELNPSLKLRPSLLAKVVNGTPVEWNINAHLLIKEIVWFGASFRPVNAITFMTQLQLTDQLTFGYSYDATLGELSTIESGSHEFMLNYRFRFSNYGTTSPRYF
ncbi:MAG: type IX secretion system membrane protein PorP/SprF [Bacteroidota bacterium]